MGPCSRPGRRHAGIRRWPLLIRLGCIALAPTALVAQTITPHSPVPAGGYTEAGATGLSWTIGQPVSATLAAPGKLITAGVQQPERSYSILHITVLLDGPYHEGTGLMHDSLRTRGLLPGTEPYSAMDMASSWIPIGIAFDPAALGSEGPDAIVDWVYVELRGADDPTATITARAALLQRDGDVVEGDGTTLLRMDVPAGGYHVAVHHRNHLSVMTRDPVLLNGGTVTIDLTDGTTPMHGTEAQHLRDGRQLLWAGDVNKDGQVRYTGMQNDRDPILLTIGGSVPTGTVQAYGNEDVNLDGRVKYTGEHNDRDPILRSVGGNLPTAIRRQQLP